MANVLLNDPDAEAILWAMENTIDDQAQWFEEHWPSEHGPNWLQRAVEIRLRFERLAITLRERAWPWPLRAERLAEHASELAAQILRKCALDPGAATDKPEVAHGAA